jgi:hypothetical protein
VAAGHAPFAVFNRTGNPVVKGLLVVEVALDPAT